MKIYTRSGAANAAYHFVPGQTSGTLVCVPTSGQPIGFPVSLKSQTEMTKNGVRRTVFRLDSSYVANAAAVNDGAVPRIKTSSLQLTWTVPESTGLQLHTSSPISGVPDGSQPSLATVLAAQVAIILSLLAGSTEAAVGGEQVPDETAIRSALVTNPKSPLWRASNGLPPVQNDDEYCDLETAFALYT